MKDGGVKGQSGEASDGPQPSGRAAMFVRKPGETTRAYLERIDIESKVKIVESLKRHKEKSTKRKKLVLIVVHTIVSYLMVLNSDI